MKPKQLVAIALVVLAGCASEHQPNTAAALPSPSLALAEQVGAPPPTPKPTLVSWPPLVQAAIDHHRKTGEWSTYRLPASVLYPYNENDLPVVACAPLRTTDIQLAPGETITDVAMGDSERWIDAWKRLIFPDTSSIDLPQMPATDQAGTPGVTDQVNNHYLATFGTAALMSLISAGQQVGQMAAFGGGGTYGPYGYTEPSPFAMAGQQAGAGASAQLGAVGQESIRSGMNRPATIEIRPGYQFNVMVTEDLTFPGPYQEHQ